MLIKDIDFESVEHLCSILFEDKHTRIEGLCSEAVFVEDVLEFGDPDVALSDLDFLRFPDTADDDVFVFSIKLSVSLDDMT